MSPPLPLGFDAKDWVADPRTIATARRAAAGMIRLMTSTSLRQWRERRIRRVPDSTDKGSTSQVGEEFSAPVRNLTLRHGMLSEVIYRAAYCEFRIFRTVCRTRPGSHRA